MRLGEDVLLLPLYTPLRLERGDVQSPAVFYGGISIFTFSRSSPGFRKPRAIDRLLDSPRLLKLANYMAGSTNAADLGDLTLSTLRGDEGFQRKELERLARWLAEEYRPDVINLPNSMFVGAARMLETPDARARRLLAHRGGPLSGRPEGALARRGAGDAQGALGGCRPFHRNQRLLRRTHGRSAGRGPGENRRRPAGPRCGGFSRPRTRARDPSRVGYLARLAPEKGFHLLAEAFGKLKRMPGTEDARLLAAGFVSGKDRVFVREALDGLKRQGLRGMSSIGAR
jgi:glycosyltransferase involved in cell wall biosynthesis